MADRMDPEFYDTEVSHAEAPELTDAVKAALADFHPDPFTQAAIWRTFTNAPGLLREDVSWTLRKALQ